MAHRDIERVQDLNAHVSNSQGRNLNCLVDSASLSSTQGMELGRERLRYLTASLLTQMMTQVTEL